MRSVLVLLSLGLAGCTTQAAPDHLTALRMTAAHTKIDLSDGVSEVEAYLIASRYKNNTSEGYVGVPSDEGRQWRVAMYETIAPLHVRDVLIDKTTGACRVISVPSTAR